MEVPLDDHIVKLRVVTTSLLHIKISDLRPYMYTKLVLFAACSIALLVWSLVEAGGLGSVARQGSTIHGATKSWIITRYIWVYCANGATYATNAADFLRYARRPRDAWWPQMVGFPLSTLIYGLIGNLIVSSSVLITGSVCLYFPLFQTETDDHSIVNLESR